MTTTTTANASLIAARDRIDQTLAARHATITPSVQKAIAEVLGIDESEVRPEATLFALGAESLDYMDLVFRLETQFHIKIPRGAIRMQVEAGLGDRYESRGMLTEEALERLRILMPEVDAARITTGLRANEITDLYTVETFVRLVAAQL